MRIDIKEKGIYSLYKYYKENSTDILSFPIFRQVIFTYNKMLMQEILNEASNIRLPYRLGYLRIKKSKMSYKHLKFDYGTYNKTGIKAFHLNEHSDDYKARILWDKCKCIVKGKRPWSFKPSRKNSRALAAIMKTNGGHKKYTEEL